MDKLMPHDHTSALVRYLLCPLIALPCCEPSVLSPRLYVDTAVGMMFNSDTKINKLKIISRMKICDFWPLLIWIVKNLNVMFYHDLAFNGAQVFDNSMAPRTRNVCGEIWLILGWRHNADLVENWKRKANILTCWLRWFYICTGVVSIGAG